MYVLTLFVNRIASSSKPFQQGMAWSGEWTHGDFPDQRGIAQYLSQREERCTRGGVHLQAMLNQTVYTRNPFVRALKENLVQVGS